MEYNQLKKVGKIYDFDGEAGTIITSDGEYIFNLSNISELNNIQNDSIVSFYPSIVKFGNEIFKVAREIESLDKDDVRKLQKENN